VRLWIVPVAAVYGLGLGLAWVGRGFQVESTWPSCERTCEHSGIL
jgi:hypothetical protein